MSGVIQGATGAWEMVIGIEIHAQITSRAKLFSGAPTVFGGEPNSQVSFIDAGMPGMLPTLNAHCVEQAVRTGMGLNAEINLYSVFDRKNYFYPDLPQGYQISQYAQPIVGRGVVRLDCGDGEVREIGVTRLHLEQDAGKSLHDQRPDISHVDLNRSGVALMEIVSEPDIRSPEEASTYVEKIRQIVVYLETCDGVMAEGSLRADVNVSMRRPGEDYGTRCEIKNVNSLRFIRQAIEYEARRQVAVLEDGGVIEQQTLLFDANKGETQPMRSKEEAHDYRYFPDPDLLPLVLDPDRVAELRAGLPELPDAKKARFMSEYGLSAYQAQTLTAERPAADYFEEVVVARDPKLTSNWVTTDLFGFLNKAGIGIADSPVSAAQLGQLIDRLSDNTISGRIAKDVFAIMCESGRDADAIIAEQGLKQVTDTGAIEAMVDQVIAENPDKADEVRAGKEKLLGWFTGQVMKASGGKANPQAVNAILKARILG